MELCCDAPTRTRPTATHNSTPLLSVAKNQKSLGPSWRSHKLGTLTWRIGDGSPGRRSVQCIHQPFPSPRMNERESGLARGGKKNPSFARSFTMSRRLWFIRPSTRSTHLILLLRLKLSPSIRLLACAGVDGVDALLSTPHRQFQPRARDMA
jgi:hypothetical protein